MNKQRRNLDYWWIIAFLLALLFFMHSCIVNPQARDYWYVQCSIFLQRERVVCEKAEGFNFEIYTERGERGRIKHLEYFKPIASRAIKDFQPYLNKYYTDVRLVPCGDKNVSAYFLNKSNWAAFILVTPFTVDDKFSVVACCSGPFMHFRDDDMLKIDSCNTLRHEMFHYLTYYFGLGDYIGNPANVREIYRDTYRKILTDGFSPTEVDAYNFELFLPGQGREGE